MRILIAGVGALGCAVAQKVRHDLVLYDPDIIEARNLATQTLYTEGDLGAPKAIVAARRLGRGEAHTEPFGMDTPLHGIDAILDATDTLDARRILNWRARQAGIPMIIATASHDTGMVFPVVGSPCWECITRGKSEGETCAESILPETIERVATLQAALLEKALAGTAEPALHVISPEGTRTIMVRAHPSCDACRGIPPRATTSLRRCAATGRFQASLNRQVDLGSVPGEVLAAYGSAVRVRLDRGSVLVHRHGLVEFSEVDRSAAIRFLERIA